MAIFASGRQFGVGNHDYRNHHLTSGCRAQMTLRTRARHTSHDLDGLNCALGAKNYGVSRNILEAATHVASPHNASLQTSFTMAGNGLDGDCRRGYSSHRGGLLRGTTQHIEAIAETVAKTRRRLSPIPGPAQPISWAVTLAVRQRRQSAPTHHRLASSWLISRENFWKLT